MYQLFHFFILLAIPFRFVTLTDPYITARHVEETFFCLAIPLGWLHLLFYLKVFRITGPFVVMIYKMIIGDIVDFSTVYTGFTLGFTLGSYKAFSLGSNHNFNFNGFSFFSFISLLFLLQKRCGYNNKLRTIDEHILRSVTCDISDDTRWLQSNYI
jgi:hypothetical protein